MPAGEIETAVIDQLRGLLRAPEIVVRTWRAVRQLGEDISEAEVREALERLDPLWNELFPAEQANISTVGADIDSVDEQLDDARNQISDQIGQPFGPQLPVRPEARRAA